MWPTTITRLDIAFCIRRLSLYVSNPLKEHIKALKKLGRYLRLYPNLGIMFRRGGNSKLQGYSNSNYAIDKQDRVLILGYVFFLYGAPVS